MAPNIDITPVMIQTNGRIIGNFCTIFQLKSGRYIFLPIINLHNTN